jgi:hypothetical protein
MALAAAKPVHTRAGEIRRAQTQEFMVSCGTVKIPPVCRSSARASPGSAGIGDVATRCRGQIPSGPCGADRHVATAQTGEPNE